MSAPLRLALVHLRHAMSGGTERYLHRLAHHLAGRGHEVTIVCRSHAEAPAPGVRFEVLRAPALGGTWRVLAFARAVERHVRAAGYDVVMGLGRTWSQDVLRLGGGCAPTYLERAHAATLTARKRLLGGGRLKHALAVSIERRALTDPRCRTVITNSELVRRDVLARYGLDPGRVRTIHNGVDLERFHPRLRARVGRERRAEWGLSESDLVVLFLGTGYGRKGLDLLIPAFARLAAVRGDARLVVAGYDSARRRYEHQAERAGIAARTRFLGGRNDPEALYAAADLYVLPTRYDPFANSTLEALASGLPVVTSTDNGGGELIDARVQGSVVDLAGDPEDLAREVLHWSDPVLRAEGARRARERAEAHGEETKFAAAEVLLREAAAARRRTSSRAPQGADSL
jgi:UDP-glucose:(heptosyl)LPS alpha-1,3-glucosyltransferase